MVSLNLFGRSFLSLFSDSEFNHERDASGACLLVSGLQALSNDDSCKGDDDYWYERTAYRKIPHSSCEGGVRLDRGSPHICPGFRAHSTIFWIMVFLLPFGFTSLIGYWYYRRSGMARGCDPLRLAFAGD